MNTIQEHIKQIFDIDSNTSATLIITIFVFASGVLINLIIKWIGEYLRRNRTKKLLEIIIEEISTKCVQQEEALNNFSISLNIDSKDNFNLESISFGHLKTLDKINFNEVFKSWFRLWFHKKSKERIESFNTLFQTVELIRFYEAQIGIYLNTFVNSFNSNLNIFNSSIHSLRDSYDTLFSESKKADSKEFANYLISLESIVSKYQRNPELDKITIKKDELLIPILELNRKSNQRVSLVMNNFILDALHAHNNMEHAINTYKELFSKTSRDFKEYSKQLLEILDKYF